MTRRALLAIGAALVMAAGLSMGQQPVRKEGASSIKVEATGTLRTGIRAIGGETTGTLIETKDGSLELDFGKNRELRSLAAKMNGKPVVVTGALKLRRGVEIPMRAIITVATLKPAE
jgi:hypothetical protein